MKLFNRLAVTYTVCLLVIHVAGEQKGKTKKSNDRFSRQLKNNNNADQMVQNILRWLQDVYGQQSRTIRQGSLREYLPPTISQKPRPFEPRPIDNGGGVDENGNFVDTGYPPAGSVTPQPPFTIYTNPATGGITGIGAPGIPGEDLSTGPGSSPKIPSETEGSSSSPGVINQDQDGEYFPDSEIASGTTFLPSTTDSSGFQGNQTYLPGVTEGTESSVGPESPSQSTDLPPVVTDVSGTESPSGPDVTEGPEPDISPESTDLPSITDNTESPDTPTDLPKVTGSEQGTESSVGPESPSESTNLPPVVTEGSGTEPPSGPDVTEGPEPEISPESTDLPSITDNSGSPDTATDLPKATGSEQGTESSVGPKSHSESTDLPPVVTEGSGTESPSVLDVTEVPDPDISSDYTDLPSISDKTGSPDIATDLPKATGSEQGTESSVGPESPSESTDISTIVTKGSGTESPSGPDVTERPGAPFEVPDVTEKEPDVEPSEEPEVSPGTSDLPPIITEGSGTPQVPEDDKGTKSPLEPELPQGYTYLPPVTDSTQVPGTESSVSPASSSDSTDLPPVVTEESGTESPSGPDITEGPEPEILPESTDLPSITDNSGSPDTATDLPKVTGSEQGTESSVGPESPSESTNLPPVVTEGSGTEPPSGPDVTEGPEPEISPESTDLPSITDNSGSPDTATDLPKATGSEQGTESSVGPESPSESTDISPIVTEGSGTESPSGPDVTERPGAPFEIPDVTEKEPDVESSEEPEIPPGTSDLPPITTEGSGTPEVPEDDKGTKSPLEPELPQGYTYLPPLTDSTQVPGTESSVSPESSSDSTDLPPVVTEGSGTESSVSPDVTKGPQPEISPESTDIPSITDNTGSPDTATDLPKVTGSEQGTESSVGPESPSESTDLPPVVTEGSGTEPPSVPDVTQGPEPEISPEYTDLPSITGSTGSSDTATDLPKVTGSEQGTESPAESTNIPPVVTEGSGTESPSGPEVTEGPDVTEKEPDVQPSEVPEISHESTALPSITDSTGPPDAPTDLPEVTVSDKGTEPTFGIEPPSGTTYFPPLPMFTEGILTIIPDENRGVQGTGSPTVPPYEPGVPSKTTYYAPSDSTVRPENPTLAPGVPETSTYYPTRPPYQPGLPSETTYFTDRPTQPPALPAVTDQAQYPDNNQSPGIPEGTSGYTPAQEPGYPTSSPSGFTGYPTSPPSGFTGYPTSPSGYTSNAPSGFSTTRPVNGETVGPSETETSNEKATTSQPIEVAGETEGATPGISSESPVTPGPSEEQPSGSTEVPSKTTVGQPEGIPTDQTTIQDTGVKVNPDDDDLKHPPHIHALDVQCAKDMMTINIEFNREFNGVIYSKGYYNMPECRYVNENSGQTKYTFTVNLNMCGTEFVNAFDTEGRSYLENILVLQNEIGIQEVWDTVRSVRCLWEGNLKEQLSVTLMVGMLSQEIVTFSGDTAMAKLDVVLGRGPFGQPASGLVKIGEQMTLVVSVSGDPGFDVQVKDCRATDSSGSNIIPLTDDNGCILKPKLFGSFQKTRNTGETGASIIAYAYFNAFKFPDVMDIMIECNIELCKTDCEMCPDANPQLEPAKRRKRDITIGNETLHDSVLMAKHLRIVLPDDLASAMDIVQHDGVCMSTQSFVYSTTILISLLTASCLLSAYLWFTSHKQKSIQF